MSKKKQKEKYVRLTPYIFGGLSRVIEIGKPWWFKMIIAFGSRDKGSPITEHYNFQFGRTEQNIKHFWWSFRLFGYDIWNFEMWLRPNQ